jgi:hypothetical protein
MVYMVSYDLMAPEGRDGYRELFALLTKLGFRPVLFSQWVGMWVKPTTAATIRDILWERMDSNDRLLVTCLDSADWAGYNLLVNPNELLK